MAAAGQSFEKLCNAILADSFSLDLMGDYDINKRNKKEGRTLLHCAVLAGKTGSIELLLANGAQVNVKDKIGLTPLHCAAISNLPSISILSFLLAKDADVCAKENCGYTPLHCAVQQGWVEAVPYLSSPEGLINSRNDDGRTPLLTAICYTKIVRREEMVKALIENGADIHLTDQTKTTPLHYAAMQGYTEIVKLLIEKGALKEGKDCVGNTPLHMAAKKNQFSTINILLEAGANVNSQDIYGNIPLHFALAEGCEKSALALIEKGADLDVGGDEGKTAFLYPAATKGCAEIVKLLIAKGACKEGSSDRTGTTPLHQAAANGHFGVVEVLLEAKANVNPSTKIGVTPLHCAAQYGHYQVVEVLIQNGALLDAKDKQGETPLHYAAQYGRYKIVELLIQKGALLDAKNNQGVTPLNFAARKNFPTIRKLIQDSLDRLLLERKKQEDEKRLTENREIEESLRTCVSERYEYKIDYFSDQVHIYYQESSAEINSSIDSHLRLFCIYLLALEKIGEERKSKISIQFDSEKPSLVLKNYRQEIDKLKNFLAFFESEEHERKFNTWTINLETILATFEINKSNLQAIQWLYCKTNQSNNKRGKKPRPPEIQINFYFNDIEFVKQFIEQLELAEMRGVCGRGCNNVKVIYPYSMLSDAAVCTKYCDDIKKKQQSKIQKQESIKNKKSECLSKRQGKIAPLPTPTNLDEISLVKVEKDNQPTVAIISLDRGQELSDADKQKAANVHLPILVKQGNQFRMGEYVNGLWQEQGINLKKLKKTTVETLNQLKFTPRLTENTVLSAVIIKKLRENKIQNSTIPFPQPDIDVPLQRARREDVAIRTLQVEDASTKEEKKNTVKDPMSGDQNTVVLKAIESGLSQSIGATTILSPNFSTIAPTTNAISSAYWQEGTPFTLFRGPECDDINYNLDGTAKTPPVAKSRKKSIGERSLTVLTQSRPDDCLRVHLIEYSNREEGDLIIRAIYYRVIQAFIPADTLRSLRNKLAHQSDMGCFLDKNNPKRQILLNLAECFAKGNVLSDQHITQMTQEIDKIETQKSDEELMSSILQELKVLKENFDFFLKEGNMPQFFNSTQPECSDACKASVIVIAECYKRMSEKPTRLSECREFRNILAHESEYSQEPLMVGILAPSINEGDFRDLCMRLSEIARSLATSSNTIHTSSSSSSSASSLAKPSL